jgi:hypothetical protein
LTRAQVHLEIVEDVFDEFGHLSSPEKRVFGAQIDLLGVDLDLDSQCGLLRGLRGDVRPRRVCSLLMVFSDHRG